MTRRASFASAGSSSEIRVWPMRAGGIAADDARRTRRFGDGQMQRTAMATSLTLALIVSSPALAAPKSGCGNEQAGWVERSVSEAAGIFWAGLLDKSVFPGGVSSVEAAIDGLDRDDD